MIKLGSTRCFNVLFLGYLGCIIALGTTPNFAQSPASIDSDESSFAALLPALEPVHAYENHIERVFEKVRPATVALLFENGKAAGAGSGVLVSPDGVVLTAGHCVGKPGKPFTIRLHDGRKFPAIGCGMSDELDCGLIKIQEKSIGDASLPYVEMGWSSNLKTGDPCLSLGHSGGEVNGRPAVARTGYVVDPISNENGMIRTSCLMEPGDSGGPLFDLDGRLIGIHSFIGKNLDANFDVPIDLFRRYWDELQKKESFRGHPAEDSPYGLRLIRSRGMGAMAGRSGIRRSRRASVRVSKSVEGGWAESQGIEASDRIYAIDGVEVSNSHQLEVAFFKHYLRGDESVPAKLKREGQWTEIELNFSELPPVAKLGEKLTVPNGFAQPNDSIDHSNRSDIGSSLKELRSKFAGLEKILDDYSVSIRNVDKTKTIARGTIVQWGTSKYVVSKSSIVDDKAVVAWTPPGDDTTKSFKPKVLHRLNDEDIVILSMEPDALAIDLRTASQPNQSNFRFLVSPSMTDGGEFGVAGAEPFAVRESGFLGVMPVKKKAGVTIDRVEPGSAAEIAGIKIGDVIKSINDKPVKSPLEMIQTLSKSQVGQKVKFKIDRDDKESIIEAKLGRRPKSAQPISRHIAEAFAGGKSERHLGFSQVLIHDSPVLPAECGGPVFNSIGQFVGINIARRSRTRAYAIPAALLVELFEKVIP